MTAGQEAGRQLEERSLTDLSDTGSFRLSPSDDRIDIAFDLPPHAYSTEAQLTLAARPGSATTNGVIRVSLNGGETINIRPHPQEMTARFALFSADLRPGANVLTISYEAQAASAGWLIDGRRSSLRLELDTAAPIAGLGELEAALGADYAAPRRIALVTENGVDRAMLEGLTVQALALRAGRVPNFTADPAGADLVVRIASAAQLDEADRAALARGAAVQGPEIALAPGETPRLVITGRNADEAAAAARLYAARSTAGMGRHFLAADALEAERLGGQLMIREARYLAPENADLRTFATSALPFSADQGSRTAVQIAAANEADRMGALSVLARAALTSGEAWIYAWYGEAQNEAPADHHLLIIGPRANYAPEVQRSSTAEWRAALRAAERSQGRRGFMRFAAAAYADGEMTGPGLGVAGLFRDRRNDARWVLPFGAPAEASFGEAGRNLARSDLWGSLEGRAAVWSERGVTPYDFSIAAQPMLTPVIEFAVDNARILAVLLFVLSATILLRGLMRRRRRVNAMSSARG